MTAHVTIDTLRKNQFLKSHALRKRQRRPEGKLHKSLPQSELSDIVSHYKDLELRYFVTRQAISKMKRDNENLVLEEDNIADEQESLLSKASQIELSSMDDVLDCFMLWHSEVVKTKRSSELSPTDKMMQRVFRFLRQEHGYQQEP